MRPPGSPEELQRRRERAVSLLRQGYPPVKVARRVGVDRRGVRRWKAAVREHGRKALRAMPPARDRLHCYFRLHPNQTINTDRAPDFLGQLLPQVGGNLLVIWDGSGTHLARQVEGFLDRHLRLYLEYVPPYAPPSILWNMLGPIGRRTRWLLIRRPQGAAWQKPLAVPANPCNGSPTFTHSSGTALRHVPVCRQRNVFP